MSYHTVLAFGKGGDVILLIGGWLTNRNESAYIKDEYTNIRGAAVGWGPDRRTPNEDMPR